MRSLTLGVGLFFSLLCVYEVVEAGKCKECKPLQNHSLVHTFDFNLRFNYPVPSEVCNCGNGHVGEFLPNSGKLADLTYSDYATEVFIVVEDACEDWTKLRLCRGENDCCQLVYDQEDWSRSRYIVNLVTVCSSPYSCQAYAALSHSEMRIACADKFYDYKALADPVDDGSFLPVKAVTCLGSTTTPPFRCNARPAPRIKNCKQPPKGALLLYAKGVYWRRYVSTWGQVCYCGQSERHTYDSGGEIQLEKTDICPPNANLWVCNSHTGRCCEWFAAPPGSSAYGWPYCPPKGPCVFLISYPSLNQWKCSPSNEGLFPSYETFDSIGCNEEQARTAHKCDWNATK